MKSEKILVINPGSTSTKVALFSGLEKWAEITEEHSTKDLQSFETLPEQLLFREDVICRFLGAQGWEIETLDAVVGRGGMLHPLDGGTYEVGSDMLVDLRSNCYGNHASNLGAPLARRIADRAGCPAFIVDPIAVDELDDPARLSGHPLIPRRSAFHALNQRSVARLIAVRMGKLYEDSRFIVAHMGGGISVGAHMNGKVVDVNNGLDGDGPFSPERTGTLPTGQVVSFCFNSGKTEHEIQKMFKGEGGIVAYCGTRDLRELKKMTESQSEGSLPGVVFEALCRQIAQAICAHGATLEGRVDAVILTGGMAYSEDLVARLTSMCEWMAPVEVVPGEQEMNALAEGAVHALRGVIPIKEYQR